MDVCAGCRRRQLLSSICILPEWPTQRMRLDYTPYYMRDLKDVQMERVEHEHPQYWKEEREPSCHAEHV
jgi:hypothetical protein